MSRYSSNGMKWAIGIIGFFVAMLIAVTIYSIATKQIVYVEKDEETVEDTVKDPIDNEGGDVSLDTANLIFEI